MEPPPPLPATRNVETHSYALPPLPNSKLRLMCSYGGHIVPRPDNKSLCYAGGETRIVAIDRRNTASTLFSFTAHLSRTLFNNRPFTLKYQLPNDDLDSLISVTTEEDLHNMLEEHDRIASSPTPSRIRLFLFPSKAESVGSVLLDPKSESWFCDALKSTMMINRGLSAESGMVNGLMGLDCMGHPDSSVKAQGESLINRSEDKHGCNSVSVPESMVLETCSSFGSTSSSISMSNFPPIGGYGEDGGVNLQDMVKVASSGSIESDHCSATAVSHPKIGIYQNQFMQAISPDTNIFSNTLESESIIYDPSSMIQMQKTLQASGYQLPQKPEQKHQQEVQYIPAGAHYIQQYPTGPFSISSHHQMFRPYQPNQPYPIYLMPIGPTTQIYNMSMPYNLNDNATGSLSRPPLHPPHTAIVSPHIGYKEVVVSPPTSESVTEVYNMAPPWTPLNSIPSNQHQQQFVAPHEMDHSSQSVATASTDNATYDNDLAYAQIYKSQPPAPALPSKYQTMTKAATVLLSEASAQLHADDIKQQVGSSLPQ